MKKTFIVLFIYFLIAPLYSQDGDLQLLNHWPDGPCFAVAKYNDMILIGNGASLDILEIDDSQQVKCIGRMTTPGVIKNIEIAGQFAYVADYASGLRIISLENPQTPFEIGFYKSSCRINDVAIKGNYAFLGSESFGVRVLDISDPASPKQVSTFETGQTSMNTLEIVGDFLYIADGFSGMKIFNISNPLSLTLVKEFATQHKAMDIFIQGDYAFVADYFKGLRIININDPANPEEIGFYEKSEIMTWGVSVFGHYAYLANSYKGISVLDITDLQNPVEIATADTPHFAYNLVVDGQYIYVADWDSGLNIFEAGDSIGSAPVASFATSGQVEDIVVENDIAFVAYGYSGLHIIDVSNPFNLQELCRVKFPVPVTHVQVQDKHVFVSNSNGLYIYDISNPNSPNEIGWIEANCNNFTINNNLVYLYNEGAGLEIYDISDINSPVFIAGYPINGYWCHDIKYLNGLVLLSIGAPPNSGLHTIDVRDIHNPTLLDFWDICYYTISIWNNSAYLLTASTPSNSLYRLDASNPDALEKSWVFECVGSDFFIKDDLAYFTKRDIYIFDMNQPDGQPNEIGYLPDLWYNSNEIYVDESHVYVNDQNAGFFIFDHSTISWVQKETGPENSCTMKSYPNPFNSSVTMTFQTSKSSPVNWAVYNYMGQEVFSKECGVMAGGIHQFRWNGENHHGTPAPSGVYYIKIATDHQMEVQKVTLIK